jgi:uncharacterized protein YjcR
MRRFQWTPAQQQAIMLARTGRYTQAEIAEQIGVTRRTIEGWARRPAWKARYQEMVEASFAEWERKIQEHARAWRAEVEASYTPAPRGARSHQTYRARHG